MGGGSHCCSQKDGGGVSGVWVGNLVIQVEHAPPTREYWRMHSTYVLAEQGVMLIVPWEREAEACRGWGVSFAVGVVWPEKQTEAS